MATERLLYPLNQVTPECNTSPVMTKNNSYCCYFSVERLMEVRDVRSYERSCHSQDQLVLTHLTEGELQDQARPYIRQLSKNTQKEL